MKSTLQTPNYRTQNWVSEVFCVERDICMIRRHSGNMRKEDLGGKDYLGAEENRIDKVDDIWFKRDDALQGCWRKEIPLQLRIEEKGYSHCSPNQEPGIRGLCPLDPFDSYAPNRCQGQSLAPRDR